MSAIVAAALAVLGAGLMVIAGLGLHRMPDTLTRSSAATKATGLSSALILAGAAVAIGTPSAVVKMGLAIVLMFSTVPLAGHLIGRSAYRAGTPLWEGTVVDDYRRFAAYEEELLAEQLGRQDTSDQPSLGGHSSDRGEAG